MGKGTIVEHVGGALYRVQLDYAEAALTAELAKLQAAETASGQELVNAEVSLASYLTARSEAASHLDDCLAAWKAAQPMPSPPVVPPYGSGDVAQQAATGAVTSVRKVKAPQAEEGTPAAVGAAVKAFREAAAAYDAAEKEVARLRAEGVARTQRIATLQGLQSSVSDPIHVWHCQSVTDLAVNSHVITAEVPGDYRRESVSKTVTVDGDEITYPERMINIVSLSSAGQLRYAETMTPETVFVNAAMEPGHEKWKPLFRYGEITAVTGSTFSVLLEASQAARVFGDESQILIDNQDSLLLTDVTVDYPCQDVFKIGDDVLVTFTGQDRAHPVIIGYRRSPASCNMLILESGAIKPHNLGGGEFSANLFIGQYLYGAYTPSYDITGSSGIDENDRLWPMGLVTGTTSAPIVGDIVAAVGDAGESRVLNDAQKIITSAYVPASLFTGKMRFFVQSLYGIKRSDISLSGSELWPSIKINNFTLEYNGRGSQWLYTTSDWRFFVVWPAFSDTNITFHFRELIAKPGLVSDDSALRDWALGSLRSLFQDKQSDKEPWALSCLQYLVLSLSSPDSEDHSTVVVAKPSTTYPMGYPLAYGWHATWLGDKAKIVLLVSDWYNASAASSTIEAQISSTINGDSVSFSASVSVSDQSAASFGIGNVRYAWVPSGVFEASSSSELSTDLYQCPTQTQGDIQITGAPSDYDLPVYGWFDSGAWKECKVSRISVSNNITTGNNVQVRICHGSSYSRAVISGSQSQTHIESVSIGGSTKSISKFSNSSVEYEFSRINPGNQVSVRGDGIYHTYGTGTPCNTTAFPGCGSGCTLSTNWFTYTEGRGEHHRTLVGNYDVYGNSGLVILHNDCEAVVSLSKQVAQVSSSSGYAESNVSLGTDGRKYTLVKTSDNTTTRWSGTDIRGRMTYEHLNFGTGGTSTNYGASSTTTLSATIFYPGSSEDIAYESIRSGSGTPGFDIGSLSIHPLPSPFGSSGGSGYSDWAAFLEPPGNVCSNGERDLSLNPGVTISAVEGAALSFGVPNPGISVGGYADGKLFIGAA